LTRYTGPRPPGVSSRPPSPFGRPPGHRPARPSTVVTEGRIHVGLFSRRKPTKDERVAHEGEFDDRGTDPGSDSVDDVWDDPRDGSGAGSDSDPAQSVQVGTGVEDGTTGPFDRSAVADDSDYLNLGAIWLKGQQGLELRLEVNEQEQQI